MLQQTTTAAVAPYFTRFMERWPTIEALAAADDADVMAAWAGLGYYARARNLLACAREVAKMKGNFPTAESELRKLPGLGAYTAAAIAAIAFGQRAVVIDANVTRVVARLFAIAEPLPAAQKAIRKLADKITPDQRSGDFAQAMMDLGAIICTSRSPRCLMCPLADPCQARSADPAQFPVKPVKKPKPQRKGRAFWIERDEAVWLIRRADKGMLGGMRSLPDDGWNSRGDGEKELPLAGEWVSAGQVSHSFTHFDLDLQLMLYSGSDWASLDGEAGDWWRLDQLEQAGLPTLFAKATRLILS